MVDYNDGKWHGWIGGKCPVHPETVVDVSTSGGFTVHGERAGFFNWGKSAISIVAFTVVKEYKEPREFWIDPLSNAIFYKPTPSTIHVREAVDD